MQDLEKSSKPNSQALFLALLVLCLIGEYYINRRYLHFGYGLIALVVGGYLGFCASAIATTWLISFRRCRHGIIGGLAQKRCTVCVKDMARAAEMETQRNQETANKTILRHSRASISHRKNFGTPNAFTESPIEEQFWQCLQRELESESVTSIVPQYSVGRYRLDFAIPASRLAIELDGHEFHSSKRQRTYDAKRDRYLQEQGWRVFRFTGTEVYHDVERCVRELAHAAHLSMRSSKPLVSTQIIPPDTAQKGDVTLSMNPWGETGKKILLVDDESALLELFGSAFASVGYDVETAPDGDIAVQKIRHKKFELVILSINMPRMNGIEVLKIIKKDDPELKVIMLSGMRDERIVSLAMKLGADAFFAKPAHFGELLVKVKELTSR